MIGGALVTRGSLGWRMLTWLLLCGWLAGQVPWPVPQSLRTMAEGGRPGCTGRLCGCAAGLCADRCCCAAGPRPAKPLSPAPKLAGNQLARAVADQAVSKRTAASRSTTPGKACCAQRPVKGPAHSVATADLEVPLGASAFNSIQPVATTVESALVEHNASEESLADPNRSLCDLSAWVVAGTPADRAGDQAKHSTPGNESLSASAEAAQPVADGDAEQERTTTGLLTLSRASCQGESWEVVPPPVSLAAPVLIAGVRLLVSGVAGRMVSDRQPRPERAPPIPPPKLG